MPDSAAPSTPHAVDVELDVRLGRRGVRRGAGRHGSTWTRSRGSGRKRTFADLDYESKKRKTRREKFLERMDGLIPWEELEERIRPFYPKAGRGRRPYELSAMLRIHCVQLFYNLSDPGMEDMLSR